MNQNKSDNQSPIGKLVIRTVAMPSNTNPHGHIFGGWIMSQLDIAGGVLAQEIAQNRIVTVHATDITFHQPAMVGDIICCYAKCIKTGKSSMTISVEMWVKKIANSPTQDVQHYRVTSGIYTYVSVDPNNNAKAIPEEKQNFSK